MQIKKNEIYTVVIEGTAEDGAGVAHIDGAAFFVHGAVSGDEAEVRVVKVLSRYGFAITQRIITPSADRVENDCPFFGRCGGCQFRNISYEAEKRIKQRRVEDAFRRIGGIEAPVLPIVGSERTEHYRNKAQLPVAVGEDGRAVTGFYAMRSHRIVPIRGCMITPEEFDGITAAIIEFLNSENIPPYDEKSGRGTVRHIVLRRAETTGEIMVSIVAAKRFPQAEKLAKQLEKLDDVATVALNINPKNTNVIFGDKTYILTGAGYITDTICGVRTRISPRSFYQINRRQAERLYAQAARYAAVKSGELLIDLYCGAGTIGLAAMGEGELIGVEIVPEAVIDARCNAELNGKKAEFLCADCAEAARELSQRDLRPAVITLDPPRAGCDAATIEAVAAMAPQRVVMISCNPATAARDCALLEKRGYSVCEIAPYDLFPRTTHVECVCLLTLNL